MWEICVLLHKKIYNPRKRLLAEIYFYIFHRKVPKVKVVLIFIFFYLAIYVRPTLVFAYTKAQTFIYVINNQNN